MRKEPWLSLEEIAGHLGVSRDTVYRWIDSRKMPAHKVGRLWKFKVSQVDNWVQAGKAAEQKRTGMRCNVG
jgi:excisionase family DNA binding protein